MQIADNEKREVTVGFAEKESPIYGYIKPVVALLCLAAISYLVDGAFDREDGIELVLGFMALFGIEAVNVRKK
jgi:hypothetical protein